MPRAPRLFPVALVSVLLLSGCGGDSGRESEAVVDDDPALSGALSEEIMVDPDLAGQNEAASGGVLAGGNGALPAEDNSPVAIAAAKREALRLVGGPGKMKKAPAAQEIAGAVPEGATLTAAARAAASSASGTNCAERADYTIAWASSLPEAFPVYPRANVQEAAGTEGDGCSLRVVNFTTPVALEDILDFYYTRAKSAGFKADRFRQSGDDMLGGTKGKASYMLYARRLPSGRTEVDLVTSGG